MRVFLADADQKLRWALRAAIEELPGLVVVGESGESNGLLAQVGALSPDVILLEWELPGRPAVSLLRQLRAANEHCRVIVLSRDPNRSLSAQRAGADACLSKADPPERFLAALMGLLAEEQRGESAAG
jgi:DNA-binding NarL/FixJ family response regulator